MARQYRDDAVDFVLQCGVAVDAHVAEQGKRALLDGFIELAAAEDVQGVLDHIVLDNRLGQLVSLPLEHGACQVEVADHLARHHVALRLTVAVSAQLGHLLHVLSDFLENEAIVVSERRRELGDDA